MSYVFMRVLETAPRRYDRGIRLLTLGRWPHVHAAIAAALAQGDRVLDIGCGTGTLAALLAEKGCVVTGIDSSRAMLAEARAKLDGLRLFGEVELLEAGAMELDTFFDAASFDAVVSTLVFSELSGDEVDFALSECNRLLEPGGRLLIADEIMPETGVGKILSWLVRFPLALVAFALTQTSTRRVSDLGIRIERAGFWLARETRYLCGTLRLYEAQKAL